MEVLTFEKTLRDYFSTVSSPVSLQNTKHWEISPDFFSKDQDVLK